MLAKANQALATLDKYRARLDQVSTRLTALEFEGGATLHDVLTVLQRSELVTRMAVEIERYIVELGTEGRLIEMQLEETMVGVAADKAALVHDYLVEDTDEGFAPALDQLGRLPHQDLLDFGRLAELLGYDRKLNTLDYPGLAARLPDPRAHPAPAEARRPADRARVRRARRAARRDRRASSRPSRASARSARRTSARAFAACRRSTSWTGTCRPRPRSRPLAGRRPRRHTIPDSNRRAEHRGPRGIHRGRAHRVRGRRQRRLPAPRGRQGPQEGEDGDASVRSASTSPSRSSTTT